MASRTKHSVVIGKYHEILKRISAVDCDPRFPTAASKIARKRVLEGELRAMGGIEAYQAASRDGERHGDGFDSSKWVLGDLESRLDADSAKELSVLDVGAIVKRFPSKLTLKDTGEVVPLSLKSIDLNPQGEGVDKKDFFELVGEAKRQSLTWGVVVLSLVLNYVDSAWRRGEMLEGARSVAGLSGLLYLVLPLASVENSRYCDEDQLRAVLECAGWRVSLVTRSAKLIYFVCEAAIVSTDTEKLSAASSKFVRRSGTKRNNFTVLLPQQSSALGGNSTSHGNHAVQSRPNRTRRQKRQEHAKSLSKSSSRIVKHVTSNQRKKNRRRAKRQSQN